MRRYVIAHWRGELSLAKSFLLNGVLAYLVLTVGLVAVWYLVVGLGFARAADVPPQTGVYIVLAGVAIWLTWAAVGIVRCAFRLLREPASTLGATIARRGFATLALVVTALVIYQSIADLPTLLR